jgi:hypothetical protein
MNTLYSNRVTGERTDDLLRRADVEYSDLIAPAEAGLIEAIDHGDNTFEIPGTPEFRVRRHRIRMTARGIGWVEDNPTNALLRKVDARPLGKVTIRRALEVTGGDTGIIRDVTRDGYVSLHEAESRMEMTLGPNTRQVRNHPDDFILLPTPKIRTVLGPRS